MNDIEQQFFKTFGIEARAKSKEVRDGLIECGLLYPEITAEKLLELICKLARFKMKEREFYKIKTSDLKILKTYILGDCVDALRYINVLEKQDFKHQVRSLFE